MSYSENFDSGAGDFTLLQDAYFDGANGFPPGCIRFDHIFPTGGGSMFNGSLSVLVATGDKLTFYYRADVVSLGVLDQMIDVQVAFQEGGDPLIDIINQPASTGDTGWQPYSLTIPAEHDGKTVNHIQINDLNVWLGEGTIYIDTIFLGTVTPTHEGRLWVYKTTDGGKTWMSRGVKTN